jgi:disulfide bond formation protein DsbB
MISFIQNYLPLAVVVSHIILAILILAIIFRRSWGREIFHFLGKNSIVLGLITSLVAVVGSLFYSNIIGFLPCDLCWWQRIFIYPQLVLFITALKFKERDIFKYSAVLSIIAGIIALYHTYVQTGGNPLIPCSATASCTKVYVMAYNYVTIPTMSLTIVVTLLILAWTHKLYEKNRNA